MRILAALALTGYWFSAVAAAPVAGGAASEARPQIGEVRLLAIAPGNRTAAAAMHREGWIEAHGQLLIAEEFPELFTVIGRAWTSDRVAQGRFAVPNVRDRSQLWNAENPFGVLGPGDLIADNRMTGGPSRPAPLTWWIFAGRPVGR